MDKIKSFLIPIVQFLVGGLFIFSGLVKMNDPVGFSFKLEEYFSKGVLNLPFLDSLALPLAILLVITEVWLGADLLMGITRRWTMVLLTGMIVFFTFLTFWSAYFNQVTDCGCFGDAIPLTPWQSFYKDIILCTLIIILWWGKSHQIDVLPKKLLWFVAPSILITCIGFTYYVLNHLPVIDFRPYAVGKSIIEGMKSAEEVGEDPPQYENTYFLVHEDGSRIQLSMQEYAADTRYWMNSRLYSLQEQLLSTLNTLDSNSNASKDSLITILLDDITSEVNSEEAGVFDQIKDIPEQGVEREEKAKEAAKKLEVLLKTSPGRLKWDLEKVEEVLVREGYEPPIHDLSFGVPVDGAEPMDITESILGLDEVWLLVAYNAKKTHNEGWGIALPKLIQLSRNNVPHFVVSASSPEEFQAYSECLAPFAFVDETQLKTMVRSNPGWVVLKNGVVSAKYHYNDTPN